ncbi:Aspartate/glutamate/uridylate kinase [Bisporella sp. PMI_857]|nr:Aspartate/glutamate/uridylate kinase [Bisporella sp. PMI_857]
MSTVAGLNGHQNASELTPNSVDKTWVVQKFGGTSVGKFAVNIAEEIVRANLKYNRIAVVCSARSTGKKVEGTTSRLLEIFSVLERVNSVKETDSAHYDSLVKEYERLVGVVCDDHVNAAEAAIKSADIRSTLVKEIVSECNEIIEYRVAAERWHLEIDSAAKDFLISFGEKLSCRFLAALLEDRGVASEFVDLSKIVHFKAIKSLNQEFYKELAIALKEKIQACEHRVPVITGYFGPVPGGLIDGEIGRGYTDLCAALVAVGVAAEELQVWKEVDGIFTADPSKVPTARLLPSITPSEAAELTFYGSEVIHHLTMDQVIHATPPIKIRIKNVKNPRGNGTVILPDAVLFPGQLTHSRSTSSFGLRKTPKRPTAVTSKDNITVLNVHSNRRSKSHGFLRKVYTTLDKWKINVDLISTSEVHVSMAIHSPSVTDADLLGCKEELQECGEVSIINKMSILSLVGAEMKNMVGIAGRMFSTLGEHNVNIEMISQGASEINISCVIDAYEATRAMNILHTNLFTFLES